MRQIHRPARSCSSTTPAQTVPIIDAATGEIRRAQIFVAVLGASNYTYACATARQTHRRLDRRAGAALEFIGGVPRADRARQPTCADQRRPTATTPSSTAPYARVRRATTACAVLPARPAVRATRPRSRPACRWSSAGSWRGCATAASSASPSSTPPSPRCCADLNDRPSRSCPAAASSAFEALDRPALRPLPLPRFESAAVEDAPRSTSTTTSSSTPLLQRAAPRWWARRSSCASRHARWRCFAPRPARGQPLRVSDRARRLHHLARAHAGLAPRAPGVDAGQAASPGARRSARHRRGGERAARAPPASRAGLPRLPGPAAPGPQYGNDAPGGGLRACPRARSPNYLREPRSLKNRPRPARRRRAVPARAAPAALTTTSAAPTTTTDPRRRDHHARPPHPRPAASPQTPRHGPRARRAARAARARRPALRGAPATARRPRAHRGARQPASAPRCCAGQAKREHRLPRGPRHRAAAVWTRLSSPRSPPASGSREHQNFLITGPTGSRQDLARVCAGAASRPTRPPRALRARAAAARRAARRPRRRQLPKRRAGAGQARVLLHSTIWPWRRLRCAGPPRPARDRRRSRRAPLHHHHQPDARSSSGTAHRRADRSPTPSSTACCTTPTGSRSRANRCAVDTLSRRPRRTTQRDRLSYTPNKRTSSRAAPVTIPGMIGHDRRNTHDANFTSDSVVRMSRSFFPSGSTTALRGGSL